MHSKHHTEDSICVIKCYKPDAKYNKFCTTKIDLLTSQLVECCNSVMLITDTKNKVSTENSANVHTFYWNFVLLFPTCLYGKYFICITYITTRRFEVCTNGVPENLHLLLVLMYCTVKIVETKIL